MKDVIISILIILLSIMIIIINQNNQQHRIAITVLEKNITELNYKYNELKKELLTYQGRQVIWFNQYEKQEEAINNAKD
jgi:uncharacterized membrane protein